MDPFTTLNQSLWMQFRGHALFCKCRSYPHPLLSNRMWSTVCFL